MEIGRAVHILEGMESVLEVLLYYCIVLTCMFSTVATFDCMCLFLYYKVVCDSMCLLVCSLISFFRKYRAEIL